MNRKPGNIPALTGIRFFAAIHVVLFHFAPRTKGWELLSPYLKSLIEAGPLSVNFFFVLSGFILAHSYIDASGKLCGSAKAFWISRFARIYPVYLLSWLIFAPIGLFKFPARTTIVAGLSSLVLVQSWLPAFWPIKWNSPAWSLSVEAFFYFVFPLLAPAFYRLNGWMLLGATGGSFAVTALWRETTTGIFFNPLMFMPCLLTGIATAKLSRSGLRMPSQSIWLWLCCILLSMSLPSLRPLSSFGAITALFAFLISALGSQDQTLVGRFLGSSLSVLLGEASYSLYLLHGPIWDYLFPAYNRFMFGETSNACHELWLFLAYAAFAIAISILCFYWIEIPARIRFRRFRISGTPPNGSLLEQRRSSQAITW